jgi:hypothetical protein
MYPKDNTNFKKIKNWNPEEEEKRRREEKQREQIFLLCPSQFPLSVLGILHGNDDA